MLLALRLHLKCERTRELWSTFFFHVFYCEQDFMKLCLCYVLVCLKVLCSELRQIAHIFKIYILYSIDFYSDTISVVAAIREH